MVHSILFQYFSDFQISKSSNEKFSDSFKWNLESRHSRMILSASGLLPISQKRLWTHRAFLQQTFKLNWNVFFVTFCGKSIMEQGISMHSISIRDAQLPAPPCKKQALSHPAKLMKPAGDRWQIPLIPLFIMPTNYAFKEERVGKSLFCFELKFCVVKAS